MTLATTVPDWTTLKNPWLSGLILAFVGFLTDWHDESFHEELSGKEEILLGVIICTQHRAFRDNVSRASIVWFCWNIVYG